MSQTNILSGVYIDDYFWYMDQGLIIISKIQPLKD